jgi:hypothetical protein
MIKEWPLYTDFNGVQDKDAAGRSVFCSGNVEKITAS